MRLLNAASEYGFAMRPGLLYDYYLKLHGNGSRRITGAMIARLEAEFTLHRISAGRKVSGRLQHGINTEVAAINVELLIRRESKALVLPGRVLNLGQGDLRRHGQL